MTTADDTIIDFVTGRPKANAGAEANRQAVERLLVESKGYDPREIEVDAPITLEMAEGCYRSTVDLVVRVHGLRYMVVKCAPGALVSREREVTAAARLLERYQIPLAVASDGADAIVWDVVTGKIIGEGIAAIPTKAQAMATFDTSVVVPLDQRRLGRQQLIFKSYDSMNVHKTRPA
jgi:hypothetical protein